MRTTWMYPFYLLGLTLVVGGFLFAPLAVANGWPIAWGIAVFLGGFGIVKLAVAGDAWATRNSQVTPGHTARESLGTGGAFALWIGFRVAVGALAISIAIWLLLRPEVAQRLMPG
ncbi:hypothetical protein LBMAG53_26960 [Planctomycetota bacterium]|nr:hypothetical protein LBMAG53_26960 [Planctomycetota bacterium]